MFLIFFILHFELSPTTFIDTILIYNPADWKGDKSWLHYNIYKTSKRDIRPKLLVYFMPLTGQEFRNAVDGPVLHFPLQLFGFESL